MQKIPYKVSLDRLNTLLQTDIFDLNLDFDLSVLLSVSYELFDSDDVLKSFCYLTCLYLIRCLSKLDVDFFFPFLIDSLSCVQFASFSNLLKYESFRSLFVFKGCNTLVNNNLFFSIFQVFGGVSRSRTLLEFTYVISSQNSGLSEGFFCFYTFIISVVRYRFFLNWSFLDNGYFANLFESLLDDRSFWTSFVLLYCYDDFVPVRFDKLYRKIYNFVHDDDVDLIYSLTEDFLYSIHLAFCILFSSDGVFYLDSFNALVSRIFELRSKICLNSNTHTSILFLLDNKLVTKFYPDNPYSIALRKPFSNFLFKRVFLYSEVGDEVRAIFFSILYRFLYHAYFSLIVRVVSMAIDKGLVVSYFNNCLFFRAEDMFVSSSLYYKAYNEIILDSLFSNNFVDYIITLSKRLLNGTSIV